MHIDTGTFNIVERYDLSDVSALQQGDFAHAPSKKFNLTVDKRIES